MSDLDDESLQELTAYIGDIADYTLGVWSDQNNFDWMKLLAHPVFGDGIMTVAGKKPGEPEEWLDKCLLAFTVAFAVKAVQDKVKSDGFEKPYIKIVVAFLKDAGYKYDKVDKLLLDTTDQVIETFKINGSRRGGQEVERLFTRLAFGVTLGEDMTNERYAVYKLLSKYQRKVIRATYKA